METSRFFVANLPHNTKENDLRQLFQDYGEVERIELKTKENLVDPENLKVLAFVTLKIGADDAQYCLNELNWQKVNGAAIKVSLAKESFLERLKREREEAEAATAAVPAFVEGGEGASELLSRNLENTRKTFAVDANSDDDEDDDSIAPSLLITKRRAASSLHNGKIVIQSFDTAPLHVIEAKKHASTRQLDAKSSSADQKRKESLNKKKNQYQQKKSAIQQSLSGLDASGSGSKKIKFSDAEEDEDDDTAANAKSKTNIFGSDNEDDDQPAASLQLRPEHFSKNGEKLVQLQSHQSLDPRFKIDAKFVDDDEATAETPQAEPKKKSNKRSYTREGERDWQMGILEQVVGTKVDTGNVAQKAAKNKKMLRYDPANDEHQKFLRPNAADDDVDKETDEPTRKENKKKPADVKTAVEEAATPTPTPEVSKEVFYVVTDTLAESLKTRGDGFSLLNMFGQSSSSTSVTTADGGERVDQLKKAANERILVNKLAPNALNPFSYDSSSDEENEQQDDREETAAAVEKNDSENVPEETQTKNAKKPRKVKVVMETFFIPKNDARLKEGAKFFKYAKRDAPTENYEEVRNRLKLLIKTKITKSKRNLVGSGSGGQKRKNKKF